MEEMTSLRNLGQCLLATPELGAFTDYEGARKLEVTAPNILNAWTHVVPALAKYAKREGRRSILGRDKGEEAYRQLIKKLRLVILGLYGDGLVTRGADTDECLYALVSSLVAFKGVYPNWTDAYSAGYRVFVERSESMMPILGNLQRSVERELF